MFSASSLLTKLHSSPKHPQYSINTRSHYSILFYINMIEFFSFYRFFRAVVEGTNFGSNVQVNCFLFSPSEGLEISAANRLA
mmetsp:Transcript_31558/g.58272  ORF Transcript_31558/g.58272 Transcript_31558/m.58272 type:complete len:82 (+) Transcript_31558:3172-3417(+)